MFQAWGVKCGNQKTVANEHTAKRSTISNVIWKFCRTDHTGLTYRLGNVNSKHKQIQQIRYQDIKYWYMLRNKIRDPRISAWKTYFT